MPDPRKCWIDDGTTPLHEAWVSNMSDTGATLSIDTRAKLPATFTVYFDKTRFVGRTCTVQAHDGDAYRIRFTGRAPRSTLEPK